MTAGAVFLLPLLSAMLLAQWAANHFASRGDAQVSGWQALGGAVGLIVGVLLAKGLLRILLSLKLRGTRNGH